MLLLLRQRKREKKNQRKMWVRKIYQERKQKGEFHLLINEMRLHDHELFFRYFRMSPTRYEHLLEQIGHVITKSSIKREPIGPSERLKLVFHQCEICYRSNISDPLIC